MCICICIYNNEYVTYVCVIFQMSFLGNWCVKQEPPIIPCDKQFLGRGPIQEVTTQKHDYTWKNIPLEPDARRADNLVPACTPIECTYYKCIVYFNKQ